MNEKEMNRLWARTTGTLPPKKDSSDEESAFKEFVAHMPFKGVAMGLAGFTSMEKLVRSMHPIEKVEAEGQVLAKKLRALMDGYSPTVQAVVMKQFVEARLLTNMRKNEKLFYVLKKLVPINDP
jgi:hypothetical protein